MTATSKKSKSKPVKQSIPLKQSASKGKTNSKKKSPVSSTKPTQQVKNRDSIYSLDSWKWNYEEVTKPKNKVVVSLSKRIKHAWEVLRG